MNSDSPATGTPGAILDGVDGAERSADDERPGTIQRPADPAVLAPSSARPPDRAVLQVDGLSKRFGETVAVQDLSLTVYAGTICGIVGPNGAGKTTTLSIITGLVRSDAGRVIVHGADAAKDPNTARRNMGVLPDRLRLFDRLTGAQLLYYSGVLHGLDRQTAVSRTADLARAFGLGEAIDRLVSDYSAGMSKKIALASAMIHSPRLLILDEPFESVDPVSASAITTILRRYARGGGTVLVSSHNMDLIEHLCDTVAIIVRGKVLASGGMDAVRQGISLESRFLELAGGRKAAEGLEWLPTFSD